jgi:DNA-binding MarR family transcriptional regulator
MDRQEPALFLSTIHRFLAIYRYLRRYARQIQGESLCGRHVSALRHLLESGPVTVGSLGDYLYIGDSSTSELVDRLESAGYVVRTRSAADNRVVIVSLTERGRVVAAQAPVGGIPLLREKLKALPEEQLSTLNDALTILAQLLEIDGRD